MRLLFEGAYYSRAPTNRDFTVSTLFDSLLFGLLTKIVQILILDNLKTEELKIILDCLDFFFNGLNLHFAL